MDLREPKRKRVGPHIKPQQAFPIPIQSESGFPQTDDLLPLYIGNYTGDCVVVYNPEEMTSLYKMGFFGKGSFSRGYPSFGQNKKGMPVVIKERQWKRRKLWTEQIKDTLSRTLQENSQVDDSNDSQNRVNPHNQIEEIGTKDIPVDESDKETKHSDDQIPNENTCQNKNCDSSTNEGDQNKEESKSLGNSPKSGLKDCNLSNARNIEETTEMDVDHKESDMNSSDHDATNICNSSTGFNELKCKDKTPIYQSILQSPEDPSSDVLVLADSDDENLENILQNPQPHLENEELKTVVETLTLTLEEAFFLSFGLGCLQVNDILGQEMSLTQQWQTFCEVKPNFIESYVSYHHFRSKGWVVKSGYKFGGDFLLYKQGPPFYHASYIVLVEKVDTQLRGSGNDITWTKFHGLNRLAENSGKDVIICQVVYPSNVPEEHSCLLKSLSKFQINEKLIKRWLPSQERIEKDV